ncbi:TPA: hypothetical protein HA344_06365 [Candidatus Bathyarchaeota archaeon]|nr:hypothetical protein [Candidatus Bathyarchaeota archaeon]
MPYTQPENVRHLVETTLTDAEIAALIEESDAEINRLITVEDAADPLIRKLSTTLTAKAILGRSPASFKVGEYSETNTVDDLEAEIAAVIRLLRHPNIKATDEPAPRRLTA